MAPFFPSRASSAAICKSRSMVNFKVLPGIGGVSSQASNFPAMAVNYHPAIAIFSHQQIVILQLHPGLAHDIAGIVELPLWVIEHVFADFAHITDHVSHKAVFWI